MRYKNPIPKVERLNLTVMAKEIILERHAKDYYGRQNVRIIIGQSL
ncbi:hypothetical protein SDC9_137910 [bioreactor metagenome]|uniref:Uncharacterized protein n=1 Tax=bioreactor metagenome TaxID=1076179 RepID=A0A645DNW2_9ZZZZ